MSVIDPFTNIPLIETTTSGNENQGGTFLSNLKELNIGDGTNVFRADKQGIWLGSNNFLSAPFRVNMSGDLVASSVTLSGFLQIGQAAGDVNAGSTTILPGKITVSGTTTLEDWRATGDTTKINGGRIYTGSVTTSQLSFTPLISAGGTGSIVATINASAEGITISAAKISISGSTTFSSGYDPTTKLPTASAGSLAYLNLVETAQLGTTVIVGGYIKTSLLTADNIQTGNLSAARISSVSLSAVQSNISDLSVLRADMGTITAGTFKVSTRINIQKSDTTAVAYLGQDPDSAGIWGFIANRGYGLMCRYTTSNYGRIFVDTSSPYPFVINMPSTDRLFITDNSDNFIANFYGRSSGLSNVGGLDMFGPIRLYTASTPPTGASNGMMFYHTTYHEVWVYKAGAWKALAYVP